LTRIRIITNQLTTGAGNWGGEVIDYFLFTIDDWYCIKGGIGGKVREVNENSKEIISWQKKYQNSFH